jgi:GH15 family glucan-1,4-alpha-glucosidase
MRATPKIQDYAVIGDGRSAALVSRDGSIDWLCWPRFDSPAVFGGLLDRQIGGSWRIAPAGQTTCERRYHDETNVLQTRFRTADGTIALTDFMPAATEEQKRSMLWPEHELVRHVECERGEAEINVHFDPRPDFGRANVRIRDLGRLGLRLDMGTGILTLRGEVPFVETTEQAWRLVFG